MHDKGNDWKMNTYVFFAKTKNFKKENKYKNYLDFLL